MFGSTLHRGANCTQVALLVRPTGEVDGGVVVALVDRTAMLTVPMLGPPDVLDTPASVAGLGRRVEPVGHHHGAPVPRALVGEVASRLSQRRISEAPPARPGAGETLLLKHPARIESLDH
jgi:hypothetical protein